MQGLNFIKNRTLIACLTATSVLFPTVAFADHFRHQIVEQLGIIGLKIIEEGWSSSYNAYYNTLSSNRSSYLNYNLRAGTNYAIVGVCDQNCSDLDLSIYDNNGNLIASDVGSDDYPFLLVGIYRSTSFQVKVRMYECSSYDCEYGVMVFEK